MLNADLHAHTIYSYDSCNKLPWIINRCLKIGINCLAITDHNEIEGAIRLKQISPFKIIVGEEVDTGEGEVIGLFLTEWIAPHQGIIKTIGKIKEQGGLSYLPHPLSISRKSSINVGNLLSVSSALDIVEIFNARTRHENSERAWLDRLLANDKIVQSAGSDAHYPGEFGNVQIKMNDFSNQKEFLESLAKSSIKAQNTSKLWRIVMNNKFRKLIRLVMK